MENCLAQMINYHIKANFSIIKNMERVYFTIRRKNMKGSSLQENSKVKVFFIMATATYIREALKIIKSMVKVSYF